MNKLEALIQFGIVIEEWKTANGIRKHQVFSAQLPNGHGGNIYVFGPKFYWEFWHEYESNSALYVGNGVTDTMEQAVDQIFRLSTAWQMHGRPLNEDLAQLLIGNEPPDTTPPRRMGFIPS